MSAPAVLLAGFAAGLLAPAGASAAVTIAPDRVVVEGDGARAVVQRRPFRLTVTDGAGRTVLSEVTPSGVPQVGATGADPTPLGTSAAPSSALYEPLAFEVGGERNAQYPGSLYAGNMLAGGRAGVAFAATAVTAAAPDGDGAKLTVATSDPSRTISLTITPDGRQAVRLRAALSDATGVTAFGDAFTSGPDEAFHGFGGRHNAIDERGQAFYNWIEQENFSTGPFDPLTQQLPKGGGERYLFPNGPTAAYYVHNGFASSRPYGFLLNQTELTRWRMASDRPDAWAFSSSGRALDYTVAVGSGPEVVRGLSRINGSQRLPPAWAQGAFLYRAVSLNGETIERYEAKVLDDVRHIEQNHIGVTAYDYEGWHGLPESFVRSINARLRAIGVRSAGYLRGFVGNDGAFFDDQALFDEARDKGYLTRTPTGQPYVYLEAANPAGVIDFTNPDAVRWWRGRLEHMLDLGFDGFMQDFGEQTTDDMVFANGETGRTMHNRFPNVYHRVTREILDDYERHHPERGAIFDFTRAGFSGRPGSAADEGANFPGDETSDYARSGGLASLASDMLNRSVLGAIGFTTDIGGYIDSLSGPTDADLFERWTQWAVFTPFMRVHNDANNSTRMPWSFGSEFERRWIALARLHDAALPLIRKVWADFPRTGVPPAAPLWLTSPGDPGAAREDQEWMVGPDVLAAPVVTKATSRTVRFPAGCWRRPETGEEFTGPSAAEIDAPVASLPYFFRCGRTPFTPPSAGALLGAAPRHCVSRRFFRIRLRGHLVSARVYLDGRRVRTLSGRRLRAPVDLRGLPTGRFAVRVVGRTRSGRRATETRVYATCRPRARHRSSLTR